MRAPTDGWEPDEEEYPRRSFAEPLPPTYGQGDDCQSCNMPATECGHVRPESPLDDDPRGTL